MTDELQVAVVIDSEGACRGLKVIEGCLDRLEGRIDTTASALERLSQQAQNIERAPGAVSRQGLPAQLQSVMKGARGGADGLRGVSEEVSKVSPEVSALLGDLLLDLGKTKEEVAGSRAIIGRSLLGLSRGLRLLGPQVASVVLEVVIREIIERLSQQTGGARAALEAIPGGKENLERLQAEAEHVVSVIALFADGFERGLRAITGGLSPIEAQVFALEEAAAANAKGLLDNIEAVRDAVALLAPERPDQADFTKTVEREVVEEVEGERGGVRRITRIVKEQVPDVEAYQKALRDARKELQEHNKEQRQAEAAIKRMALAAIGLGEEADEEPLTGAALALEEMRISFKAMRPVLREVGFTASETNEKIKEALKKAKKELREGFDESIDDQLARVNNPFGASFAQLEETQEQRLKDAEDLGADVGDVERLNSLERLALVGEAVRAIVPDLAGFEETLRRAQEAVQENDLSQKEADKTLRQVALSAIGLGEAAKVKRKRCGGEQTTGGRRVPRLRVIEGGCDGAAPVRRVTASSHFLAA